MLMVPIGTVSMAAAMPSDLEVSQARHRAHLIVYMMEKRVGMEAVQRVLRDIVAEAINLQNRMGYAPDKLEKH